jgi:hypothetical protein
MGTVLIKLAGGPDFPEIQRWRSICHTGQATVRQR